MTGEMLWITKDGHAGDGNEYPVHATLARILRCPLAPFDTYIGPYLDHAAGWIFMEFEGRDARLVLWPGGEAPAFRKPLVSDWFDPLNHGLALNAAAWLLARAEREVSP